jgi:hypothetical protein
MRVIKNTRSVQITINGVDLFNNTAIVGMKWSVTEYKIKTKGVIFKKETSTPTGWELHGESTSDGPVLLNFDRRNRGEYDFVKPNLIIID